MQNILRIDMGAAGGPTASLDPDARYAGLAGRAMTSLLVAEEVDPACHALGGANKLVLAPGDPGSAAPRARAVSVGCKSPLDGGIVASGAAGPGADALRRLGYRAVVLEGQPPGDDVWTIVIDEDGIAFAVENAYRMLGNLETIAKLRHAHGGGPALFTIGPAGEMGLGAASLTSPERALRPAHCGLGGAGAVLGSKRVKAIVVAAGATEGAPPGGAEPPAPDEEPRSPFRDGCGIRDPVVLRQLREIGDDLGVDAAEVAAAVSLAMEAGLARPGDGQAALRLVEEIARGSPLGRIVGSGLCATAEAFGLEPRVVRWRLAGAPPARPLRGAAGALELGSADLGEAARQVLGAERRFLARARAAAAADGEPGVRPHPIVFGPVDDDMARLFGAADPDADPFDPQLQLHVGLRAPQAEGTARPARLPSPPRRPPHRN